MRQLIGLLIVVGVLGAGGWVRGEMGDDEGQLRDLELGCATALVAGDTQWLDSFYDQDWFLVGSDGQRYTRKQVLTQLRNGNLKWMSCAVSDMDIQIFGDTAIVVYKAAAVGEVNGVRIEETEVCSDSFVREGGRWRCVHSHNCQVP